MSRLDEITEWSPSSEQKMSCYQSGLTQIDQKENGHLNHQLEGRQNQTVKNCQETNISPSKTLQTRDTLGGLLEYTIRPASGGFFDVKHDKYDRSSLEDYLKGLDVEDWYAFTRCGKQLYNSSEKNKVVVPDFVTVDDKERFCFQTSDGKKRWFENDVNILRKVVKYANAYGVEVVHPYMIDSNYKRIYHNLDSFCWIRMFLDLRLDIPENMLILPEGLSFYDYSKYIPSNYRKVLMIDHNKKFAHYPRPSFFDTRRKERVYSSLQKIFVPSRVRESDDWYTTYF